MPVLGKGPKLGFRGDASAETEMYEGRWWVGATVMMEGSGMAAKLRVWREKTLTQSDSEEP